MDDRMEALDAVVLYDAVPAGKRAFAVLGSIAGLMEEDLVRIQPRPWRLDFMHAADTLEVALRDLRAASLIILSTTGEAPLPAAFKIWFAAILDQRRGERVVVVALLGPDDGSTRAASRDREFIERLTLEVGVDFCAPGVDPRY